jgi:lipooligosaccharide transport system permease protein
MRAAFRITLELISVPDFRIGTWRLLKHHWLRATYHPVSEAFVLLVEPVLTLFALALGLSPFINEIDGRSFPIFILPAVLAFTTVFIPYWESAYGVFSRLKSSSSYWAILQTPMSAEDLATGEILWATTKGVIAGTFVLLVGVILGWADPLWSWLSLMALIPGSLFFASLGLWVAASSQRSTSLLMMQSFVLGPLALWSDTIFPFSRTSWAAAALTWASPVTHVVRPIRRLCAGEVSAEVFLSLAIIWLVASMIANLATIRFSRRLVPSR